MRTVFGWSSYSPLPATVAKRRSADSLYLVVALERRFLTLLPAEICSENGTEWAGRFFFWWIGRAGLSRPELRSAVEAAFRWASYEHPHLDKSLLATWAEQIGSSMAEKQATIGDARRYAFSAIQKKVMGHARLGSSREFSVGISQDLEEWAGSDLQSAGRMERHILFRELREQLNDRDRDILILLQQDITSPAGIASALGIGYNAAAKAIQRLKARIRAILIGPAVSART